jgi:hypothetical protein
MKTTPKVLTIEEVEDAILLGQEVFMELTAEIQTAYYKPLQQFMEAINARQSAYPTPQPPPANVAGPDAGILYGSNAGPTAPAGLRPQPERPR